MTCAEAIAELAELLAAEKAYLLGKSTNMVRYGEKSVGRNTFDYPALQQRIRVLQPQVDRCNGCRRGGAMIGVIPVDSNSSC